MPDKIDAPIDMRETALVQCVPNFSEGRRPQVIAAIVGAVTETLGVRLADWSTDPDHNRLVVTFLGPPSAVREAAYAATAAAIEWIDVGTHQGVHPRLGAVDVLPFVPLRNITLAECAILACSTGQELAARHGLPVFLYEAASPYGHSLPYVRKSAFSTLDPDFGPAAPHPTAGAVVVGARRELIAFNVNLATRDIAVARAIARALRANPGLPGVRALGLALESRAMVQVSMNITQPWATPLLAVLSFVQQQARERGTDVAETEIIGALPGYAAFGVVGDALQAALKPDQVLLETWRG